MFEPKYLGQVRVKGLGQSQSTPTPSSSDSRFAVPAADQNFIPQLTPFMVPFMSEWPSYPQGYAPDRYDCVLNGDGLSWTCTPKVSAPPINTIMVTPPYPVVVGPFGPFGY